MIELLRNQDKKYIYDIINNAVKEDIEKYKFFIQSSKMTSFKSSDAYSKEEFISVIDGRVQGYFAYIHDRINEKVINIELISFNETTVFLRDFIEFCKLINETFENIEIFTIPENPAYRISKKYLEKYNFKKVGTLTNSIKLIDGRRYNQEIWEKKEA